MYIGKNASCFARAKEQNLALLKRDIDRFWGEGDHIKRLLVALGREYFTNDWSNFVDVGAGTYAAGGDDTLMKVFSDAFSSSKKHIVGFEPFEPSADVLREMFANGLGQKEQTIFSVLQQGCGELAETDLIFTGQMNTFTANRRIALHPKYAGTETFKIQSTSVDALAQKLGWQNVHVLKTDTEGREFEVLLGAKQLISKQLISLIIVAYEDKWTWDSFTAAYPVDRKSHLFKEQIEFDTPNLYSVCAWLSHLNYSAYLLGADKNGSMIAIPLSDSYWDDAFEIGRNPHNYDKPFTWFDFVAAPKGSDVQLWIEQVSVGTATC